jgi:hypothetical protein
MRIRAEYLGREEAKPEPVKVRVDVPVIDPEVLRLLDVVLENIDALGAKDVRMPEPDGKDDQILARLAHLEAEIKKPKPSYSFEIQRGTEGITKIIARPVVEHPGIYKR